MHSICKEVERTMQADRREGSGPEKQYHTSPDFLLREIGGDCVLVPLVSEGPLANSVIALNDSSRYLWEQFQEPRTVESVVEAARSEWSDPDGTLEQDVQAFVDAYLQVGLLIEEEI